MSASSTLRSWLPQPVRSALGRATGRSVRFVGGWPDWSSAARASGGYDDAAILRRVVEGTRAVVAGRAAFERDSVLFNVWQPPFQILAPLLRHALRHDGALDVVDFGGSLGSTFRQCRAFLPPLKALRWHVVEQPGFVDAGRAEFTTDELGFHLSLDALPPPSAPRLLLASSVLQYLPSPAEQLDAWSQHAISTILIDRTPVWPGTEDQPCVQRVPRHIYPASYPLWILSRQKLLARMAPHWQLICDFDCPEGHHEARAGPGFDFKGFHWERR